MLRRAMMSATCLLCVLSACNRGEKASPSDSAATDSARAAASAAASDWVTELGPLFVVPADSDANAMVVFPDAVGDRELSGPIALANAAGDTIVKGARLLAADSMMCGRPVSRIATATHPGWTFGFRSSSAYPLHADSIEGQSPADSARAAADLIRLASSVATTTQSRFRGLPFSIASARGVTNGGTRIVVAHLIRRLNQEASPLEEHSLVVAERALADKTSPAKLAFSESSEGTEETADHFEVLAVVASGRSVFVVLARENVSQLTYEILERNEGGEWRRRWSRTVTC